MTTDQLTGRALDEAAARAMGWRFEMGAWYRGDDSFAGNYLGGVIPGCLTEREMLAWLHERGIVKTASSAIACDVEFVPRLGTRSFDYMDTYPQARGRDLREALERLVVAVAAREAREARA